MRKKTFFSVLFALMFLCNCNLSQNNDVVDVSQYKAVFTEPPQNVPTVRTPDGPLAGNGDIGITMGGTPDSLRFFIGKNDFWWPYEEYPYGIALPGGLRVTIPALKGADYYAEQRMDEADIISRFTKGDLQVDVNVLVPATRNMAIFEFSANQPCAVNLDLWTQDGHTSVNRSGYENGIYWTMRSFDNPDLVWPCHIAMAMKAPESLLLELKPGKPETIAVAIYTNFDSDDWKQTAIAEASAFTRSDMKKIRKEHRSWWDSFWKESFVSIGDPMLEKFYYGSTYIFAMTSRAEKTAPGIWGCFISDDNSLWGGDYHLNYNYQSPFWAYYSSNHMSLVGNFDQPLLDYMPRGREHAREIFNCRGIIYPVGLGPRGYCTSRWPRTPESMLRIFGSTDNTFEGGYQFHGQKINAVFGAGNMFMHFYSTYDENYAKRVYPYLLACADFWEDYLSFEDGRYVIRDDHFNETSPTRGNRGDLSKEWGDMNSTLSLGLVNMLFKGILDVSDFLQIDQSRHEKWRHILAHMSKIPVGENADGRLSMKSMERGPGDVEAPVRGTNRITIHGLVLPTGFVGPSTNPELNAILMDDISRWRENKRSRGNWGGGGFETVYPGATRVGFDANVIIEEMKERIETQHFPNLWINQGGGGVETLSGVPHAINEMLMQSYEGVIRIFPNWIGKDARFRDLRAYGAFLVSSSMSNGEIPSVTIKSEKGRVCLIENPWKGSQVQVDLGNGKKEIYEGDFISIPTSINGTLTLTQISGNRSN